MMGVFVDKDDEAINQDIVGVGICACLVVLFVCLFCIFLLAIGETLFMQFQLSDLQKPWWLPFLTKVLLRVLPAAPLDYGLPSLLPGNETLIKIDNATRMELSEDDKQRIYLDNIKLEHAGLRCLASLR
jgi:hypothetical protein